MIISDPLVSGEVKQIRPNIFAVIVKDSYDRGMLFCRYQEFYESPFDDIRGKYSSLEYLMRTYVKKNKKTTFTYTNDWVGYNIPSDVLYDAFECFDKDMGMYDHIMKDIVYFCEKKTKGKPFYLIGVDKPTSSIMNHEIAHGLYYTNKEYKESVTKLINDIPQKEYNFLKKQLIKIGYIDIKEIIDDEIQAFLSTGIYVSFNTETIKRISKRFKKNFKSFV